MPASKRRPADASAGASLSLTLKKGLVILSLFDSDHPEWAFGDIWRRAGLSRPTAFRLVKTLEESKYLSYDPRKGTYHLGMSILKGTYLMLSPSELARIARPHMLELEKTTIETVILAVFTDGVPVIAERVLTSRPFKPDNPVGLSMPGLANVHARIFLAYAPETDQRAAIAGPIEKRTDFTTTDRQKLGSQLAEIRREGIAFGAQEWNVGMCAVGAPVFDAGGQVRASLAVVAPVERFGPTEQTSYAAAVKKTAAEISAELGHRAPAPHQGEPTRS
jgi:IclR family KDG regulon transcriptional repressor